MNRYNYHDYEQEDDEELPEYELPTLPQYERRDSLSPVATYALLQADRKLQVFLPPEPSRAPSYHVVSRSGPSLFSKKADITLRRIPPGGIQGEEVAGLDFVSSGPLPWVPRAKIAHRSCRGTTSKAYSLEARNFADWKIVLDRSPFVWCLDDNPTSLVLVERDSDSIVSRFSYSAHGTRAAKGEEVGTLAIFGGWRTADEETVELVMASCMIAIMHWKRMGRHYRKGGVQYCSPAVRRPS